MARIFGLSSSSGMGLPPPHVFAEFDAINVILDQTKTMRYPELLTLTEKTGFQIRTSDSISSLPNMPHQQMTEFLQWHYQEPNNASLIRDPDIGFSLFSMALQPIPVGLQRKNFIRAPAALQTDPANGDKLWVEYSLGWTNSVCDETCPQSLINVVDSAKFYQQEKYPGVKPTNYVSGDLSVVPYSPLFAASAGIVWRNHL